MELAMKQHQKQEEGEWEREISPWDCGSPLYDSFEVASLCHLLDRHLMFHAVSGACATPSDWPAHTAFPAAKKISRSLRKENLQKKKQGEEKNPTGEKMKVTLRGICTSFITFWRKP